MSMENQEKIINLVRILTNKFILVTLNCIKKTLQVEKRFKVAVTLKKTVTKKRKR